MGYHANSIIIVQTSAAHNAKAMAAQRGHEMSARPAEVFPYVMMQGR
jgi:hypothetical protein